MNPDSANLEYYAVSAELFLATRTLYRVPAVESKPQKLEAI